MLVTIIPRTNYNFSYLASTAKEVVRIAGSVDVSRCRSGQLIVRLHENKILAASTATVTVKVFPTAPSSEDPRAFTSGTPDATVSIVVGDAAPKYFNAPIATINGSAYTIEVEATQGATTGGALGVQISVDLVLRET